MATEEKKTVIAEEETPASKKAAPKKAAKATKAKKAVKKEAVEEKKEEVKEAPKATEASAKLINYGVTPRKVRLVIDLVRGKDLATAYAILDNCPKRCSHDIKKLIQWYNILVNNGITDFEAVLAPTEGDNVDDRQEAE